MPLEPGLQVGPYEIAALIGAGGMGEVYRARDTRLGRTVAIKVLSTDIADKPSLRERFEREAQSISALNHPAICTLHDVGRHEALDYLVMEFLEGETLADRLVRGPIPLKEALAIAAQIGEGLEAAHRRGIVHRDLKPANVMLVKVDGTRSVVQPKLLDFGLAKLRGGVSDSTPVVVSAARTDVATLTTVGMVLGTLQYMSPEQLEGKDADVRSDIFAFGTMLYEMLTGRKAFEGKSQVSLMAAILEQEPPPVSTLQPVSPRALDHVVRGCLAKDPAERWQSVADIIKQLKWIADDHTPGETGTPPRARLSRTRVAWAAGLLVLAFGAGVLISRILRTPSAPAAVLRFDIAPPPGAIFPGANSTPRMAVSPDGRSVAFTVNLRDGKPDQLWIRRLDSIRATPLVSIAETSGEPVQQPFWSPDSRFVAFFVEDKLKKIELASGIVQTLCSVPGNQYGGTWSGDTILFASSETMGVRRVSASGGIPSQVTSLEASSKELAHLWPRFLPDGRHFLYQARRPSPEAHEINVGMLDASIRVPLLKSPYMADFAPPDRLFFVNEGTLLVQRFNANALRLLDEPIAVAEGVQVSPGNGRAGFSVSANGVLVYRAGVQGSGADSQLAWVDRTGKEIGRVGSPVSIRGLDLSPTGDRLVFHQEDGNGSGDLWISDIERGTLSRLTFDPTRHSHSPIWTPDGSRVIFGAIGESQAVYAIYEKSSNGVGEERLIYESKVNIAPWSVSPDGKTLVLSQASPVTGQDLMTIPLAGGTEASGFIRAPGQQLLAQISPDGRWLAYSSTESGVSEVYVQSFPTPGTRYQVSTMGGTQPRWRRDGRELFYRGIGTGGLVAILAASVESAGSGLRIGIPGQLFDSPLATILHTPPTFSYAVAADGQRILASRAQGEGASAFELPLTVVVNWDATLR